MPASKLGVRVRFKVARADEIAASHGLTTIQDKAAFFGTTPSSYSRVVNGVTDPGELFIAAVLASHPGDPDVTFDGLFEVVDVTE